MAITTIGTHGIGTDVIVAADIAANAVTASELADDAVDTAAIANNAVTGAKIALASQAAGDIMYYNGTDWIRVGVGTDGQVLTVNNAENAPGWEAASAGATLSGSTNNTIVTVTGANAMTGESTLTYSAGQLTLNYDSGVAQFNIDASNGQSLVIYKNAGTAKWAVGIDTDGSTGQKSHIDDWCMYSNGAYPVVISGNGDNKGGIGTIAGIATDGNEIPIHGITQGKGNRAHTQYGAIACLVTKSGNQTLPDTTETPITWNVESHDTDDGTAAGGTGTMHDTSTNSERIYARTAGWYLVGATCALNTGYARMVLKHDSTWISNQRHGVSDVRFSSSAVDYFTAGTYFKVEMSQWSGSKVIYASNARAWMIRIA